MAKKRTSNSTSTGAGVKELSKAKIDEPLQFHVIFFNDDFTTTDFVVSVLMVVFNKPQAEATALMLKVHHEGSAVVGSYSFDMAMSKANRATAIARHEGFPLKITVEEA